MISAKPRFHEKAGIAILLGAVLFSIPLFWYLIISLGEPTLTILLLISLAFFIFALIGIINSLKYFFGEEIIIEKDGILLKGKLVPWRELKEIRIESGRRFFSSKTFGVSSYTSGRRGIKITLQNGEDYGGVVDSQAIYLLSNILNKKPIIY